MFLHKGKFACFLRKCLEMTERVPITSLGRIKFLENTAL